MKSKTWKRFLACVLALVMVVGMLPISALAARADDEAVSAVPAGEEAVSAAPETGRGESAKIAEAYTPETAVAEGKEVHYLAFDAAGFTNGTTATAVTFQDTSCTPVTSALTTGTNYRIVCNNQVMSGIYTSNHTTNGIKNKVLFRWAYDNTSVANRWFRLIEGENGGYKIQSQFPDGTTYYCLTHDIEQNVTLGNNTALDTYIITTTGEEFYITPASDSNDGTYYIWYTTERVVDPEPSETIEHHQPTEGMNQHYLQYNGSSAWIGGDTDNANIRLDAYDTSYTQYTAADVPSGTYAIYSSRDTQPKWMHVVGTTIDRCTDQENIDAHRFLFAYDAAAHGYTIQSKATSKYLHADRNSLSMSTEGTIFYIDKVDNTNFYHVWWESEVRPGEAIGEMFNAEPGNTWVFTGGADVAGQFEQTRGRRSFAGQFEEYVRWHFNLALGAGENSVGGFSPTRQRYVINTAYADLTLNQIVSEEGWAERVTAFSPRAVTYMVGGEDLANESSFETDLAAFIDKATALRDENGFAVIMKSYDSELAALNAKVDSVVAGYQATAAGKYSHIVVVDALTLTDDQKTADGHPNADGHMELGRNLAVAVGGVANNFPGNAQNRYTEAAMPTFDKTVTPTVAWTEEGGMTIGGLTGAFTYQVKLASGVTVSGTGTNTATVTDLPDGAVYSLITRAADGATQYQTVTGLVGGGEVPAKTGEQKKIADLLAAHPDDSLTWLFVGDSITHGILVSGYDSAPQLMEEYLDTIGRTKDIVVNAGVSSATTASTLNAKDYRLKPFTADVAIVMLGTNDCSANLTGDKAISKETYKENLGKIVTEIRANNPNAIIVLRTPTGHADSLHPNMSDYVAQLEAFAEEEKLILVDQRTATQNALDNYSWCRSQTIVQFYGDALHPGVVGQLKIFQMLIREMGLWNDDNEICNLDYLWTGMTTENSSFSVSDAVRTNGSKLTLSPGTLDANLGRATLTATNAAGQSWSVTAEAGETPSLTLPDGTYTVAATGVMKNAAKTVTFAAAQVEIDANAEPAKMPAPAEVKIYEYVLNSGELTSGVYAIVAGTSEDENNYPRSMHYWTDTRTNLDQCSSGVPANAEKVSFNDIAANHLWNVEKKANGKYTFAAVAAAGNYLTGGAGTLTRGTEATEFTVAARGRRL